MTRNARSLLTILGLLGAIVLVAALMAPRGVASSPQPSTAPARAPAASPAAVVPARLGDIGPHTFTVLFQASGDSLYRPTFAPGEAATLAARPVSVVWTDGYDWWNRFGVVLAGSTMRLVVPDRGATLGSLVLMQAVPAQAGHRYLLTITTTPLSGTAMDLHWTLTDTGNPDAAGALPAVAVANGAASLLLAPSHLLAQPQYWNEPFAAWQVLLATSH